MSTDKIDPSKKNTAVVGGELTEEQLNSVTGGDKKTTTKTTSQTTGKVNTYLEYELTNTGLSGY